MDEEHLGAALRYVALNPVRAGLADRATDWAWSSVHAQLDGEDGVTSTATLRELFPDFTALLAAGEDEEMFRRLRRAETIGRPIGDAAFLERLERGSGRTLVAGKRGRRPRGISALSCLDGAPRSRV